MERKTPLYDRHTALGGKIVPFAGYLLPIEHPTSASGKALITDQKRGFIKRVVGEDGVLLGAQLMCAHATDMVGELALAQKLTVAQVAALVRTHPTF